jgi:hypothetical protein
LNAANNGVAIIPQNGNNGHRSLATSIAAYLDGVQLTKKPKSHAEYSTALAYLAESCRKPSLDAIARTDLLKFAAFLRDEKETTAPKVPPKTRVAKSIVCSSLCSQTMSVQHSQ